MYVPRKWREGQPICEEYAFSTTEGALNFAPPIITRNFTLGTFVSATPYTYKWPFFKYKIYTT